MCIASGVSPIRAKDDVGTETKQSQIWEYHMAHWSKQSQSQIWEYHMAHWSKQMQIWYWEARREKGGGGGGGGGGGKKGGFIWSRKAVLGFRGAGDDGIK